MPDGVLPGFAIEASLSIDVNIEFEPDIMIKACKNHAIRYCSSPDFSAFEHLKPFEDIVKYIDGCPSRSGWRWKTRC